jgi:hypothetical protein
VLEPTLDFRQLEPVGVVQGHGVPPRDVRLSVVPAGRAVHRPSAEHRLTDVENAPSISTYW